MLIALLLIVHVFIAITAFGLLPFPAILAKPMIAGGDVRTIRSVFSVLVMRARLGGPLSILGALTGLWLVHVMGYSYTAGWLIAAYIVFAILVVVGIGVHARWEQRVLAAAQASADGSVTPALTEVLGDKLNTSFYAVSMACWFILFYLMVGRPF